MTKGVPAAAGPAKLQSRATVPWWVALTAAALTILVGCDSSRAREHQASREVEVVAVELGRSIRDDKSVRRQTDRFKPDDTVYVSLRLFGINRAGDLRVHWYQTSTLLDSQRRLVSPNGLSRTEFHYTAPDGFAPGSYEVAVFLDDQEIERRTFRVE